jgi:hypothetical protein
MMLYLPADFRRFRLVPNACWIFFACISILRPFLICPNAKAVAPLDAGKLITLFRRH